MYINLQVSVFFTKKDKPDNELKQCTNKWIPVHRTDNELNKIQKIASELKIIHKQIKLTNQNSFVYIINAKRLTPLWHHQYTLRYVWKTCLNSLLNNKYLQLTVNFSAWPFNNGNLLIVQSLVNCTILFYMSGYERAQLLHVQIKINPPYTSSYCYLFIGPDRTTVGKLRERF